jgi:hypothetical protein
MFRIRRDRPTSTRFLALRVGLIFLAAGVWFGGVLVDERWLTGAAIVILLPALLLGILARREVR